MEDSVNDTLLTQYLLKKGKIDIKELQHILKIQKDYKEKKINKSIEEIILAEKLIDRKDLINAKNSIIAQKDLELNNYLLLKKIGEGGMGEVYKAIQLSLERVVAIKLLAQNLSKDTSLIKRFTQEAQIIANLDHPNIIKGIDFGETNGIFYYVMEFLEGKNVYEIVKKKGPFLDTELAINILIKIAEALNYAHLKKLVHRDIKPENIVVCNDGRVKLCDLGLAKWQGKSNLTSIGTVVGTPYYISPEQAEGKIDVDIRSDIYSLGATFYFMLTGEPPYEGENPVVVYNRHIHDNPPKITKVRKDLPKNFDDFFNKIMAKDINKRIQTPKKLIEELNKLKVLKKKLLKKMSPSSVNRKITKTPSPKRIKNSKELTNIRRKVTQTINTKEIPIKRKTTQIINAKEIKKNKKYIKKKEDKTILYIILVIIGLFILVMIGLVLFSKK